MSSFEQNALDYKLEVAKRMKNRLSSSSDVEAVVEMSFVEHGRGFPFEKTNKEFLNPALDSELLDPIRHGNYAKPYILEVEDVITADGVKQNLVRLPAIQEICVIDWLSITLNADILADYRANQQLTEEFRQTALISNFSQVIKDIFGFSVDYENRGGRNVYARSWTLEHDTGFVCIGGNNNTIQLSINGTGCTMGKVGWESHLHAWLNLFGQGANITRIDLCNDDLTGQTVSVDYFFKQHKKGGFKRGGRPPSIQQLGDWYKPNGKGRTLAIGSRQSSVCCRIYEKGKQLGDKSSLWCRTELELKNKTLNLNDENYDILINPSKVFLSFYPCFWVFENQETARLPERKLQQLTITYEQFFNQFKTQYARTINFLYDVYKGDTEKLFQDLTADMKNKAYPERVDILTIPPMAHKEITL